jgi:hypothetical protein
MKKYKIYISGLYVGTTELDNKQVNKLVATKNITIKEI